MIAKHIGLGVKFGGICPICQRETGKRPFELERTSLYKDSEGQFYVVHPRCAGGDTKTSNRVKYSKHPAETIEVSR